MSKRIAMISYHTCPLASEEGKETGGMNVYVLELSKSLAKAGFIVDIYTRSQHHTNPKVVKIAPNLRLIHLECGPTKHIPKKELIEYIPEFVNSYLTFTKENNLNYDLLHCHYYLSGLIGLDIKNTNPSIAIIMTFHTLALMKNLVARDELEKEEIERIDAEYLLADKVKKIIVPTASEMDYLRYLYNTDVDKISIISPGVNTSLFKPFDKAQSKEIIGADDKEKIILFVGRIEPLKGLDMLLYAMKVLVMKNPNLNTSLWIVGGDISQKTDLWSNQLRILEELRKILHLSSQVKFVGQQHQHKLPYFYNASEIVIMPSHYESFGIVALEAMACGIPVITTDVAGISSLIDRKHEALITSVNNPLLLTSQIEGLLNDKKLHDKISQDVLKQSQNLSWEKVVKKIISVYDLQ